MAYVGPYRSGSIVALLNEVTGGNALFFEGLGLDAEALAAKALFGAVGLPRFHVEDAHYVLSFGASFLGASSCGPELQTGFARAKDANSGGFVARFVAVTPLKDQTSANADDWHACVPGTEAMVALAIARLVADAKGYNGPATAMLAAADVAAAATASGVPQAAIEAIAKDFAANRAVALPGGVNGASAAATRLAGAVYLLNVVSGHDTMRAGGYQAPIASLGDLQALVADMEADRVGVLIVDDVDLVHALPGEAFSAALAKVGTVVSVAGAPSETSKLCKLHAPTHSVFEDWGDEEPWAGTTLLRQPGMNPLGDTRSLGDLLIALWRAFDAGSAPKGTWRDWLWSRWAAVGMAPAAAPVPAEGAAPAPAAPAPAAPAAPVAFDPTQPQFRAWLDQQLKRGLIESGAAPAPLAIVGSMDLASTPEHAGDGAYHLVVFAHPFYLDGRYANEPWAQETPDPMTGIVWDTWALVHPETAEKLGVEDNSALEISGPAGKIVVGVEVHPCIAKDTIGVPMGGGHTAAGGRYAADVGANVVKVLPDRKDPSGALVLQGAKVGATVTAADVNLVSTFGNDTDSDRNFAVVCEADEWSKVGDAKSDHPGHLNGIHHLEMDRRLLANEAAWRQANPDAEWEKRQYTDFYPVPDHPTYRFAMTIDTNACTGCSACMVACQAENNLPVVGKWKMEKNRQMHWIRINRYFGGHSDDGSPSVHFVPMLCQQCGHAPCESVCPVLATYHTIDGLNAMVYNRCVGTRYCANACPYSVRRFNYHSYVWPEPFNLQLNPDVVARTMGVMEKCTFCVQRIRRTKAAYRAEGFTHTVPDEALEQLTACAEACPSQAITFGNLIDPESTPHVSRSSGRTYFALSEINTFPAINYLSRASFHVHRPHHGAGGGEHAEAAGGHHEGEGNPTEPAHDAGHN